ncbi:MAG TPA: lipopolysaccharide biosynthesis protein [Terriglobales bacterium]|nr:lipopolysaccharide biosynthesis protein [Terriglobales bacterium]
MNPLTQTTIENSREPELLLPPEIGEIEAAQPRVDPPMITYARLLWPKRALLAKATLAGLLLAAIASWLLPNTYEASVQLMPPDNSSLSGSSAMLGLALGLGAPGLGGGSGGGSPAGGLAGTIGDLLGSQKPGPLFIGILSSRSLSDRMIDRFDLLRIYKRKYYAGARRQLLSQVTFKEDKKSGIIRIAVSDHDRWRATAMTEAYIDELNHALGRVNNSAASREREFLEERLVSINAELKKAGEDLAGFSSRNATLDPQDQGKAMLDAAAMLQGQLIAARSELSGLQQIYTSENVRVRSLQAHVAELEKQLNDLGGKGYSGDTKLDPNALYPSIRQLPVLDQEYGELYRKARVDEVVFELLTEAYEMARVQEAKDTPVAKVLDLPRVPERPAWPPRMLLTIAGGFLAFLFTSFAIVGADHGSEDSPYRQFFLEASASLADDWAKLRSRFSQLVSKVK